MDQNYIKSHTNILNAKLSKISNKLHISNTQFLIALIYPIIIILGQLSYLFSPTETSENYFTSKSNFFNVLFVKVGWFWNTLIYILLILDVQFGKFNTRLARDTSKLTKSLKRFGIVTLLWFFYSQWFFGMPLMDKIFILTGGSCYNIPETIKGIRDYGKPITNTVVGNLYSSNDVSSFTCRRLKGKWYGGHDPSGHIYLLSLSSMFLLIECFEFYNLNDLIMQLQNFKSTILNLYNTKKFEYLKQLLLEYPLIWVGLLIGLWFWMLLMTSIYFHSLIEKLFGLMFGYLSAYIALYFIK
ncbi:hypothetical protein CANARDRAFT_197102 [[Candida] arabinofermentans NRRL YB-2248]|uniref:Acyl-coenzyme A diphosphatase SCS3 n=1 Tax=[Candida] arabinofermentans NRRL YB-2248 TaxID=983967 RepID=A0A1E4T389_9ASCO|nr:hypothetical protein CANARDRAFT_197102 [[Candida] arabinofermentans NRRL YB-2248]